MWAVICFSRNGKYIAELGRFTKYSYALRAFVKFIDDMSAFANKEVNVIGSPKDDYVEVK
jgi:hypothetical protein